MSSVWYPAILVLLLQAGYITASVRWPKGTYALLKPTSGCPDEWKEHHQWEKNGEIVQSTYYSNNNSTYLNITGKVAPYSVSRYFCIKTSDSTGSTTWPKGQYCVYGKYLSGDRQMYWGSIKMYNSWNKNNEYVSTACKDTIVDWSRYPSYPENHIYMQFYFSCQTQGDKKIPIELPITKPFYLLPYGSRDCQQVKWMVATTEWIKYHIRNYVNMPRQKSGTVPYHELGRRTNTGITMFYCYYQSCNHTLTDMTGAFQSPGFPGKYPDGQLCSWRITVPVNHTVHVNFMTFSLYEYDEDCVQLYKYIDDRFKLRQAFFGHQQPFNITATRDLMFVFRSDEENHSTGFRAKYEILKIPERTTTAKPPTTTSIPTTEKPTTTQTPTTKLPTTQPPTTKLPTTQQLTTKLITTNLPMTTEGTNFNFTQTNGNCTTNDTVRCRPTSNNHKSSNNRDVNSLKKTSFCDETWRIVVMVIPLIGFILIVVVTIDIFYRCRYKNASKSGTSGSVDEGMVVNQTYEGGDITVDQPTNPTTDDSTLNTIDDQPLSRDEPPDYEDVDYTQLNEVPTPNGDTAYAECHALQLVGNDAPEVFYHVLEPPTADLDIPTYQNLSEVNHYTLNPVYESAETSAPLFEANQLYDQYIA